MNSELIKVIEREAEAEKQRILEASRQSAAEMVQQARTQAAELEEKHRSDNLAWEKAEMAKAESTANLQAMAIILSAKSRAIEGVFRTAYDKIRKSSGESYKMALKSMIAEAAAEIKGDMVILAAQADLKTVQELAKAAKLKAEVRADPQVAEGIIVTDQSGNSAVLNRFSDRLERAKPSLMARVSEILWG